VGSSELVERICGSIKHSGDQGSGTVERSALFPPGIDPAPFGRVAACCDDEQKMMYITVFLLTQQCRGVMAFVGQTLHRGLTFWEGPFQLCDMLQFLFVANGKGEAREGRHLASAATQLLTAK